MGALQAEQNAKAAQTQAASQRAKDDYRAGEKAYDIAQAKAIQQQARDDYRAGERGYAIQQAEKAEQQAGLSAYYESRKAGEEKVSTGGSKGLAVPALDGGTGWWDTVKGTINDGINQVRNEVNHVVTNVKDNAKDAVNSIVTDVKNIWNGSMTLSQAWNNSVAAVRQASDNSLVAMDQGYTNSQRIYRDTVDQTIQKTAVWLDEKRNPFYDLGVYGLEQINNKKLVEARKDVFLDLNPLDSVFDLGKPDYFEAGINYAAGYWAGISKSLNIVGIPETRRLMESGVPDNNQVGFFYSPGIEITTPGASIVSFYGTGYMLPGPNKDHPSLDRYRDSFIALGMGGYSPIMLGGGGECYISLTDLKKVPEGIDDTFGWLTTPALMPLEQGWQKYISGEDIQDFPKINGRGQTLNENATAGCRVYDGMGTIGPEVHGSVSDSQYVNILGGEDNRWRWVNVPTPIMNAIIDLRFPPSQWGW